MWTGKSRRYSIQWILTLTIAVNLLAIVVNCLTTVVVLLVIVVSETAWEQACQRLTPYWDLLGTLWILWGSVTGSTRWIIQQDSPRSGNKLPPFFIVSFDTSDCRPKKDVGGNRSGLYTLFRPVYSLQWLLATRQRGWFARYSGCYTRYSGYSSRYSGYRSPLRPCATRPRG